MSEEKFLTVREVAQELGINEQGVLDLVEQGRLSAYKIGGVYLRFKRQHVQEVRRKLPCGPKKGASASSGLFERISDFFYFNDFYILALIVVVLMLLIIFKI